MPRPDPERPAEGAASPPSRDDVAAGRPDHRGRLLEAMAQAVRSHGLQGSTVALVVQLARVSRRTFYEQFSDLTDCYLVLMTMLGDATLETTRAAVEGPGTLHERIDRAVADYLAMLELDPLLSRSYFVESHLTGERGVSSAAAQKAQIASRFHALARDLRAEAGVAGPLPYEVSVMLTGALRELVLDCFLDDRPPSSAQTSLSWLFRQAVFTEQPPDQRGASGRPDPGDRRP